MACFAAVISFLCLVAVFSSYLHADVGDASKADLAQVQQVKTKNVLPITQVVRRLKPRTVTAEERKRSVHAMVRKAFLDEKLHGIRERRAKIKEAEKAAAALRSAKKESAAADDD